MLSIQIPLVALVSVVLSGLILVQRIRVSHQRDLVDKQRTKVSAYSAISKQKTKELADNTNHTLRTAVDDIEQVKRIQRQHRDAYHVNKQSTNKLLEDTRRTAGSILGQDKTSINREQSFVQQRVKEMADRGRSNTALMFGDTSNMSAALSRMGVEGSNVDTRIYRANTFEIPGAGSRDAVTIQGTMTTFRDIHNNVDVSLQTRFLENQSNLVRVQNKIDAMSVLDSSNVSGLLGDIGNYAGNISTDASGKTTDLNVAYAGYQSKVTKMRDDFASNINQHFDDTLSNTSKNVLATLDSNTDSVLAQYNQVSTRLASDMDSKFANLSNEIEFTKKGWTDLRDNAFNAGSAEIRARSSTVARKQGIADENARIITKLNDSLADYVLESDFTRDVMDNASVQTNVARMMSNMPSHSFSASNITVNGNTMSGIQTQGANLQSRAEAITKKSYVTPSNLSFDPGSNFLKIGDNIDIRGIVNESQLSINADVSFNQLDVSGKTINVANIASDIQDLKDKYSSVLLASNMSNLMSNYADKIHIHNFVSRSDFDTTRTNFESKSSHIISPAMASNVQVDKIANIHLTNIDFERDDAGNKIIPPGIPRGGPKNLQDTSNFPASNITFDVTEGETQYIPSSIVAFRDIHASNLSDAPDSTPLSNLSIVQGSIPVSNVDIQDGTVIDFGQQIDDNDKSSFKPSLCNVAFTHVGWNEQSNYTIHTLTTSGLATYPQ